MHAPDAPSTARRGCVQGAQASRGTVSAPALAALDSAYWLLEGRHRRERWQHSVDGPESRRGLCARALAGSAREGRMLRRHAGQTGAPPEACASAICN
jgi:hypothetical protein